MKRAEKIMLGLGIFVGVVVFLIGAEMFSSGSPQGQPRSHRPKPFVEKPQISGAVYAPILMYHHVSATLPRGPYNVSPAIFEKQMLWLRDNKYNVIPYAQFFDAIKNKKTLPENPVVITFDDGYLDQYKNAFPILKKYGYTAMFFIGTGKLDKDPEIMTWSTVKNLAEEGMEIGSHTISHPNLTRLSANKLAYELQESKKDLEDHILSVVHFFAYPGGSQSADVAAATEFAGYTSAVTTVHTVMHEYGEDPFLVGRIHIDDDMESFVDYIHGRRL